MTRAKWLAGGLLAGVLASLAGARAGSAQTPVPATRPAPFIKPLPEPAKPPATKPAEAPYIAPITQPAVAPTTKPAPGPFIKPIGDPDTRPTTAPTTAPAIAPVSQPTTQPVSKPVGKPIEVGQKTVGFSPWVPVDRGRRCMDLSLMPADVHRLWLERSTTRGRILTERAAKAAAMRKLARRVGEMPIAPGLTVGQFLATTDQPNASEELFLRGAAMRVARYHADKLVVEVEVEIRSRTVLASLKSWARGHVKGDGVGLRHIENALLKAKDAVLRERGTAELGSGAVLKATTGALRRATKAATQPGTIPTGAAGSKPKTATATALPTSE